MSKKHLKRLAYVAAACVSCFTLATALCLKPVSKSFDRILADSKTMSVTDRMGQPLMVSYKSDWNHNDHLPLYAMPEFLTTAFVYSEDRKFFDHGGVDWPARAGALYQNIAKRKTVRGASTITEQVIRMVNPRSRNIWSKWLEGIEASLLEIHTDKATILEFYLNQIPYASERRGISQAARYYYNRNLDTLSAKEMLSLVVLARAPSAYDLYRSPDRLEAPLQRLARLLKEDNKITATQYADIQSENLNPEKPSLPVEARHFARYARLNSADGVIKTSLDSTLQSQVQDIIDSRLKKLAPKNVANAAALVVDHSNGSILAWVVGGARDTKTKGGEIDAVITARQPGSTLKPFLYADALEKGWTAATILNDAPIAEAVGSGLHRFRNYSNTHYGPITLREALGNSLNIPAVLAIHYVGVENFLTSLHKLGFDSLDRGSSVYDEGLALGNGEVTLYELVRAYSVLADRGQFRPLHFSQNNGPLKRDIFFREETASIIGNILSDPKARALEFGSDSILNLPVKTAIKTGTSTDYRDAWTIGYNDRYTVGIWMGNLDRTPMKEVTGSTGPALALRSIFHILNQNRETSPLYLSPALIEKDVCTRSTADCPTRTELFAQGTENTPPQPLPPSDKIELVRPTQGLMMAYDPRVPAGHQKFRFELAGLQSDEEAEWILNGKSLTRSTSSRYLWPLEKGRQSLSVKIYKKNVLTSHIPPVMFIVR